MRREISPARAYLDAAHLVGEAPARGGQGEELKELATGPQARIGWVRLRGLCGPRLPGGCVCAMNN